MSRLAQGAETGVRPWPRQLSSGIIRTFYALALLAGVFGPGFSSIAQEEKKAADDGEVRCKVEGLSKIVSIVPEGTVVKKGHLVCELDAVALRARLAEQQTVVQKAKDALQAAEKIRESAELAMKNSGDAVLKQQAAEAEQEVKSAENDLAAISDRVDLANRMWEQGKISKAHKVAEELAFQKAKFAIELIQTKRMLLQDQTRPRILKTLP